MGKILESLQNTVIAGLVLTILIIAGQSGWFAEFGFDQAFYARYLHVVSGVMWIGLLWYFNFVQIPNMPNIPDEQKPAIGKVIAPAALWWFRWGAMFTFLTGLGLLHFTMSRGGLNGYIIIGALMGTLMFLNVWLIIWPNQKIVCGITPGDAAKAAPKAGLASRTNTLFSAPMLIGMLGFDIFQSSTADMNGIEYMMGGTGGYLLGYVMATVLLGVLAQRGWDRSVGWMALAMLLGNILLYIPGLLWLGTLYGWDKPILAWGLTPFILGDALKLALAAMVLPLAWKLVGRARG